MGLSSKALMNLIGSFLGIICLFYIVEMRTSLRFASVLRRGVHGERFGCQLRTASGKVAGGAGAVDQEGKKGKNTENTLHINTNKSSVQGIDEIRKVRVSKMEECTKRGINPFAYSFTQTHKAAELQKDFASLPSGEENLDVVVSVSGRIMTRRVFGKLAFFTLQDDSGTIQLYLDKERLPSTFGDIKDLTDAGDIIGAKGTLKRTEKVAIDEFSLHTLPFLTMLQFSAGRTIRLRERVDHVDEGAPSAPR